MRIVHHCLAMLTAAAVTLAPIGASAQRPSVVPVSPLPSSFGTFYGAAFDAPTRRAFVVGGYSSTAHVGTRATYSGIVDSTGNIAWRRGPDYPMSVLGNTTFTNGVRVYVFGGDTGSEIRRDAYVSDIQPDGSLGPWNSYPSLPRPLHFHAILNFQNQIYVFAGRTSGEAPTADVSRWDGAARTWSRVSTLPVAMSSPAVTYYQGYVYVAGGSLQSPSTNCHLSSVYAAPMSTTGVIGTWRLVANLPQVVNHVNCEITSPNIRSYFHIVGHRGNLWVFPAASYATAGSCALDHLYACGPGGTVADPGFLSSTMRILRAPIQATGDLGVWTEVGPMDHAYDRRNFITNDLASNVYGFFLDGSRAYMIGGMNYGGVTSYAAYFNLDEGSSCNDGNSCTYGDTIQPTGTCRGIPITCANDPGTCGARRACNGSSTCSVSFPTASVGCDDVNACTVSDRCNGAGRCVGTASSCDDGNPCTTDSCNPATGCARVNNTNACNDGNACTTLDRCNGTGRCAGTATSCDDGNPCTTDTCNPASGCARVNNTNACNDGNACTTLDRCNGAGRCAGTTTSCDDGNPCTTDSCNPASGCARANNTNACNDGDACTTLDRCNGAGRCAGTATSCDDGNPCTTDRCVPTTGCVRANNTEICNDGNACTALDRCNGAGRCTGTATSCDDGNPCTTDTCNPTMGCARVNNTGVCDDRDPCTTSDRCGSGTCMGSAIIGCGAADAGRPLPLDAGSDDASTADATAPDATMSDASRPDASTSDARPDSQRSDAAADGRVDGARVADGSTLDEGPAANPVGCGCRLAPGRSRSPLSLLLLSLVIALRCRSAQRGGRTSVSRTRIASRARSYRGSCRRPAVSFADRPESRPDPIVSTDSFEERNSSASDQSPTGTRYQGERSGSVARTSV